MVTPLGFVLKVFWVLVNFPFVSEMFKDLETLQEDIGLYVIDGLLEEIRLGMEVGLYFDSVFCLFVCFSKKLHNALKLFALLNIYIPY